jgi:hypothetical protein
MSEPPDFDRLSREAEFGYDMDDANHARSVFDLIGTSTDANLWAYHFRRQFGGHAPDQATLATWFEAAMEAGRQSRRRRWQW